MIIFCLLGTLKPFYFERTHLFILFFSKIVYVRFYFVESMDRLNRIEVHEGQAEVLPKLAYTTNLPTPKQVHFPKPSGI